MKPALCPKCGYLFNAHTPCGEKMAPRPNDISLCLSCGAVSIFRADLSLTLASREEWQSFDDETLKLLGVAQLHILERGPIKKRERVQ